MFVRPPGKGSTSQGSKYQNNEDSGTLGFQRKGILTMAWASDCFLRRLNAYSLQNMSGRRRAPLPSSVMRRSAPSIRRRAQHHQMSQVRSDPSADEPLLRGQVVKSSYLRSRRFLYGEAPLHKKIPFKRPAVAYRLHVAV